MYFWKKTQVFFKIYLSPVMEKLEHQFGQPLKLIQRVPLSAPPQEIGDVITS